MISLWRRSLPFLPSVGRFCPDLGSRPSGARGDLAEESRLSAIVQAFKRAMFGPRSEKLDPAQLEFVLKVARREIAKARAEKDAAEP